MNIPKNVKSQDARPRRGDIWRVNLEPTVGSEIKSDKGRKGDTRPVLVLSRPRVGEKAVCLCAPITDYKPERDELRFWRVEIGDTAENGLHKMSCIDVSQTRALDTARFMRHDGRAHHAETQASAAALARCVGYIHPETHPETDEPL